GLKIEAWGTRLCFLVSEPEPQIVRLRPLRRTPLKVTLDGEGWALCQTFCLVWACAVFLPGRRPTFLLFAASRVPALECPWRRWTTAGRSTAPTRRSA